MRMSRIIRKHLVRVLGHNEELCEIVSKERSRDMWILKILFLPIYLPIAIIIGILKLIGIGSFTKDVMDWFD